MQMLYFFTKILKHLKKTTAVIGKTMNAVQQRALLHLIICIHNREGKCTFCTYRNYRRTPVLHHHLLDLVQQLISALSQSLFPRNANLLVLLELVTYPVHDKAELAFSVPD